MQTHIEARILRLLLMVLGCVLTTLWGGCFAGRVQTDREGATASNTANSAPSTASAPQAVFGGPDTDLGTISRGGTIRFTNIGAPGFWGRRLDKSAPDAACDVESKALDLGLAGGKAFCCRQKHQVVSSALTPFDEEMMLVMRGPLLIRELGVYQPATSGDAAGAWNRVSYFSQDANQFDNLKISAGPSGQTFAGAIGDACAWYAMLPAAFACGTGSDPYCPETGPDLHNHGWAGSKLVVLQAMMPHTRDLKGGPPACSTGTPSDAPWIGFSAAELMRDGWGKYYPCHCYDNTDSTVGAGCGEINVFEVISELENTNYGNSAIVSTGLRSFQVGSLGGNTCGKDTCSLAQVSAEDDLIDGCARTPAKTGSVVAFGSPGTGCPVWQRPTTWRYLFILLNVETRTISVGMVHPKSGASELAPLLPNFPALLNKSAIDALGSLSLPR